MISNRTKAKAARKAAPYVAKGGAKVAKTAGRQAVRGAKTQAKLTQQAASSSEPRSTRYVKYAVFAVAGFAVGSMLGRAGGSGQQSGTSSSFSGGTGQHSPESGSPAAERGQTWGSGSSVGSSSSGNSGSSASGPSRPGGYQAPGDPNEIGADRDFSDPNSGPLVGETGHPEMDMTERNQITEQQIRTGIGEQVDTEGLPKINVEVNDGIVELRGPVPSEDIKQTIERVASETSGVREVRSSITVADV